MWSFYVIKDGILVCCQKQQSRDGVVWRCGWCERGRIGWSTKNDTLATVKKCRVCHLETLALKQEKPMHIPRQHGFLKTFATY